MNQNINRGDIISTPNRNLLIIGTEIPTYKKINKSNKEILGYELPFDEKTHGRFIRVSENLLESRDCATPISSVKPFLSDKKLALTALINLRKDLENEESFKGSNSWMKGMESVKVYYDVRTLENKLNKINLFS